MKKILFILYSLLSFVFANPQVIVYESPSCGCCAIWSHHLRENGFETKEIKTPDFYKLKTHFHIPENLQSCHTAIVDGYFIEGHVPAEDIQKLLSEKPKDILGLIVAGMPIGSPGMEQGNFKESFKVLALKENGETIIWNQY